MLFQLYTNIYIDSLRIIRLYVNDYKLHIGGKIENNFKEYEHNMPNYMQTCIGIIRDKISNIIIKSFSEHNCKKTVWDIMPIIEMNELYIPSIDVSNSDVIIENIQKGGFYDGPFFFLPYCHVYKCIVGIQGNENIHSIFSKENKELTIHKNEIIAYDFNRDAHYIYKTEINYEEDAEIPCDECIMLKLHYIIFPLWMPLLIIFIYKKLHIWFNMVKWIYKNM